jgi:DNA-binding response OmpR family regulator
MAQTARVLIVDGDEQVRVLLHQALFERGVPCNSAASADEARVLLAKDRFGLLLLHLEMPGAEDLLAALRSMRSEQRPIVMVTANIRTPKDAVDTDLVQVIIRRPLRIAEVTGIVQACREFLP